MIFSLLLNLIYVSRGHGLSSLLDYGPTGLPGGGGAGLVPKVADPVMRTLPFTVKPSCPGEVMRIVPGESAVRGVPDVESWAWTVKLNGPGTVGVPEMVQVAPEVPMLRPVGSAPALIEQV